jgi:hypothetical protein
MLKKSWLLCFSVICMGHSYGVMKLVLASSVMGGLLVIYFIQFVFLCSVEDWIVNWWPREEQWCNDVRQDKTEGTQSFSSAPLRPPSFYFNPSTPNGHYIGRTAPLTFRHCILNIYSKNIRTEYFKHAAWSPFFSFQNAVYFIMLPCLVTIIHIINTGCAKI